jgi:hypothetical protein
MSVSLTMIDGLIAGVEAGSEIPVTLQELKLLKTVILSEQARALQNRTTRSGCPC